MSVRSTILTCAGVVAATLALSGQAASVKGTVTVGATKVTLANASAVSYKAPNGQLISVLLSDKPADAKAFAADTKTGPGEPLVAGLFEARGRASTAKRSSRVSRSRLDRRGT